MATMSALQTPEIVNEERDAIPLTILTGFLGSGKTTLLNRILNGSHGLRVAVLVNDFGAINIDAELVVGVQSNVISLANGCVCCTIRDDLVQTVKETIARPERPEYILLEASGVAEPSSIAMTFNNPGLRESIRLDSIVCVVDADQVFAAQEMMELKLFQMACSDMIVLNKVDLVGTDRVVEVRKLLDSRFHRYRLIETSHCDVPLEILLSVGRFEAATTWHRTGPDGCSGAGCDYRHHDHATEFSSWSFESDRPLSWEALRKAASKLPVDIYRAKGVIHTVDCPERRTVLQEVGRRVDLSLADSWSGRTPATRIVAIGAPGSIDAESLQTTFEACVVS
jgi:G3E family GTPase